MADRLPAEETERRLRFLEEANRGYAALRADPQAWAELLEERRLWDATLMDGLEDDPYPLDEGQLAQIPEKRPEKQ